MRKIAAVLVLLFIGLVAAGAAFAQTENAPAILRGHGAFVAYDATAETISVRERKVLRAYAVIAEGDHPGAATRVSIEGDRARLEDLEAGAPILVSWRHDPNDAARRVAVALEVPKIPKSFRENFR